MWTIVVWSCFAFTVRTETKKTVAVVHTGREALAGRLFAELISQGFSPKVLEREGFGDLKDIREIARSLDAAAVMQIARTEMRVSVWVSGKTDAFEVMQEVSAPMEREDAVTLVVFKSVELLRASLLVLPEAPPRIVEKPVPAAPDPNAVDKQKSGRVDRALLFLDMEPSVTYGFGATPPLLQIGAALRAPIWKRIELRLFGLIPTLPMRLREAEGRVEIRTGLVSLALDVSLLPANRMVALTAGGGAGPLIIKMQGVAADPYVSKTALLVVALPYLAVGFSTALSDALRLRLDLLCGFAPQKPVVRMLDRNVTDWARPMLSLLLGMEVKLF